LMPKRKISIRKQWKVIYLPSSETMNAQYYGGN